VFCVFLCVFNFEVLKCLDSAGYCMHKEGKWRFGTSILMLIGMEAIELREMRNIEAAFFYVL
jgi:hypothetical protein